jgi:hypothetical protein
MLTLLKGYRIVPQYISAEEIKKQFSQARFHEAIIRKDSTWEEKEKDAGQLNFREFLDFLVRLTPLFTFPASTESESDVEKANSLMSAFYTSLMHPRHDSNLKQIASALGVKPATAASAAATPDKPQQPERVPVDPVLLAMLQSSIMLKHAFIVYAAKNQFKAKAGAMDRTDGFDVSGSTLLDVGEVVTCLKAFKIIPRLLLSETVKSIFSQVCKWPRRNS